MRLFEAIIEANHRAVAGDAGAGLRPAEFAAGWRFARRRYSLKLLFLIYETLRRSC
jgi:hypothetical protein